MLPTPATLRALFAAGDDRPLSYAVRAATSAGDPMMVSDRRPNPPAAESVDWSEVFGRSDALLWDSVRDSLWDLAGVLDAVGGVGVQVVAGDVGVTSWREADDLRAAELVDLRYLDSVEFVDRWGAALAGCGVDAMGERAVSALVSRLKAYIAARPPIDELAASLRSVLEQADRLCTDRAGSIVLPDAVLRATRGWVLPTVLGVLGVLFVAWRVTR